MSGTYAQPNAGGLSIPGIPLPCAHNATDMVKIDTPRGRAPEQVLAAQVVSKQRVTDHGEVYTAPREVQAMLHLVKPETERIDSRFLEPACGNGNFLAEILARKLRVVESRYAKSQLEYERNAVTAVASLYGIDKLEDNAAECRRRLFDIFNQHYTKRFKRRAKDQCRGAVWVILQRNIIHGNALTLETVGEFPEPIVFSEWSFPFHNSFIKRRDYIFSDLLQAGEAGQGNLFLKEEYSDLGQRAFIPKETRSYGSLRRPRLPVTTHYSDRIAYLALQGIKPMNLEGDVPYWL